MFNAFLAWIEQQVDTWGIGRILLAPFGAITVLSGLGLLNSVGAVRLLSALLLTLIVLVLIATLFSLLRKARSELELQRQTVRRYSERLIDTRRVQFSVESWIDEYVFTRGGRVELTRRIILIPHEDLMVCEQVLIKYGDAMPDAQRRRVKFEARSWDEQQAGARYNVTETWQGNRHAVQIHFPDMVPAGEPIGLQLTWDWPGYSKLLLDGGTEDFDWLMRRPARSVSVRLRFDKSCDVERFATSPINTRVQPTQQPQQDGAIEIVAQYIDPPEGQRFGFRLDAHRRGAR